MLQHKNKLQKEKVSKFKKKDKYMAYVKQTPTRHFENVKKFFKLTNLDTIDNLTNQTVNYSFWNEGKNRNIVV